MKIIRCQIIIIIIFYSHKEEHVYGDWSWSRYLLVSIIVLEAHGLLCVI